MANVPLPISLSKAHKMLRKDKRMLIFSIFVLISTVLWLLNKLSFSYTTEVPAKIELTTPVGTDGARLITEAVTLHVHARGFDILKYKFLDSHHLIITIQPSQMRQQPNGNLVMSSSYLHNAVAPYLGSNIELQRITPDSIVVINQKP